jgi:hypothetical protein
MLLFNCCLAGRTENAILLLMFTARRLATAVVQLFVSQSLHNNGSTCHNIKNSLRVMACVNLWYVFHWLRILSGRLLCEHVAKKLHSKKPLGFRKMTRTLEFIYLFRSSMICFTSQKLEYTSM